MLTSPRHADSSLDPYSGARTARSSSDESRVSSSPSCFPSRVTAGGSTWVRARVLILPEDRPRAIVQQHPSLMERYYSVGVPGGELHVVGHDDHELPLLHEIVYQVAQQSMPSASCPPVGSSRTTTGVFMAITDAVATRLRSDKPRS